MKNKMSAQGGSAPGGKTKIIASSLAVLGFLVLAQLAGAQTPPPSDKSSKSLTREELNKLSPEELKALRERAPQNRSEPLVASNVNCFDYYKFQSVQVSLGMAKNEYDAGEKIIFEGELINQNAYPVVDGYVFARIGRKNPNYVTEGHYTIEELVPFSKINLDAKEKRPVSFEWTVPKESAGGEYRADFFFSVGKKFNLGGLPFTNEIIVGLAEFKVKSNNNSFVSFEKSGTLVNGQKYNHIGNLPVINPGEKVNIIQPVKNTFSQSKKVSFQYDLYFWDSLNEKDKLSSKTEEIELLPNKSLDLTYEIPKMNDTVYYLKITASYDNQKSIVNIRVASNQERARLNYPAITNFPLKKGESETIFSCFHNTSSKNTKGRVTVVLEGKDGKQIGKMEYEGDISGAMMADKKDFQVSKDYDWIKLVAGVTDERGKIIDSYENVYDCKTINSAKCQEMLSGKDEISTSASRHGNKNLAVAIIVILFAVSIAIIWVKKRKAGDYPKIVIFMLFFGVALFDFAGKGEAYYDKTVTVSEQASCNYSGAWSQYFFACPFNEISVNYSVTHQVGMSAGNYNVNKGDPINFYYSPTLPYFNATGWYWDTPYGNWCGDDALVDYGSFWWFDEGKCPVAEWQAIPCTASCQYQDYVSIFGVKPAVYMNSQNNSVVSCNGMNCTAVGAGTARVDAVIPATKINMVSVSTYWWMPGLMYSRYLPEQTLSWDIAVTNPCAAVNVTAGYPRPASINRGDSFELVCGYDRQIIDSRDVKGVSYASSGTGECAFNHLEDNGYAAIFNCTSASSQLGLIKNFCGTKSNAEGGVNNYCSSMREVQGVNVVEKKYKLYLTQSNCPYASGSVSASPQGTSCGTDCYEYSKDAPVTLTANPNLGSYFTSWGTTYNTGSSSCSGTSATCSLSMDGDKTIQCGFCRDCACGDAGAHCKGDVYGDSCGNPTGCEGTKDCDAGDWREVAP